MFTRLGLGQIQAAGLKDAAPLPGFLFQLFIQVHCVMLNTADICAVVQAVNICSSMPRRSRCQFIAF